MVIAENKELKKFNKVINNWLIKKDELLLLYGRPFQSNVMFAEVIEKVVKDNGKVLYIWGNQRESKKITRKIVKTNAIKISYSKDGLSEANIVFMNFKYAYNITRDYDLIIIDDISTYSKMNSQSLEGLYEKVKEHGKKILIFTIESTSMGIQGQDISNINIDSRFIEPRSILTRIDLKKDIPYMLYEYILWFKERNKKIVFFVPYHQDVESLFNYYMKRIKLENVKIIKSDDYKDDLNIKDRAVFIITNNMEALCDISKLDGIVTLFADNPKIDYKKIIYMCGKVTKYMDNSSEVILVCRDETEEIEVAKSLTRNFNKKLWEENYLKL